MRVYERHFARLYDFLVHNCKEAKTSEEELGFIDWALGKVCLREVRNILDVGCGNGRFMIPLAKKGYKITGIDNSLDMLEECRRRLSNYKLKADLLRMDLERLSFNRQFDAVICMDSVICYLLDTERIINTLGTFRQALRPEGILILENWNFFANWDLHGKTKSGHAGDNNVEIEYQEKVWYENFSSIFHNEIMVKVQEDKKSYEFTHKEVLKGMTAGEIKMYLKEVGFVDVSVYPSWDRSEADSNSGDEMIFLAIRT